MIVILTGGTEETRLLLLGKLKTLYEYEFINNKEFKQQKSQLEQSLPSQKIFVISNCFLKSHRYEIYC
ncbi:hypothetical protein COBT_003768, partial [Conglomerata obtusa]